ncbi:MAG: ABC transporter ATP-binding protein [Pseudomonadota bacterium]
MASEAIPLHVDSARLTRGDRHVLDGIDLSLQPGSIYALLGPNGAGKSSLVRAIAGLVALDSGTIRLNGRDPRQDPGVRRSLGVVPQEIALYENLTAMENLMLFGRIAGLGAAPARQQAAATLQAVGLADRADDRIAVLSGGMCRRLNIGAALVHNPELVLLDEPTVGVDAPARGAIAELLISVRGRGATVLIATHDMAEAETLADRVGIMVDGRLVAEGTPQALTAEVFGTGQDVLLHLAAAADEPAAAALVGAGLAPSDQDPLTWYGTIDGGLAALAALSNELSAAGVAVDEARLREPGLAGVYLHVVGREFDA